MFKAITVSLILFTQIAMANFCGSHFMAPKIVLISGTDRAGSNTLKITNQVAEMMSAKGHDVKILNLAEMDKAELNGDYFKPSAVFKEKYITKISEADGVLFVFPEYYGDMPGVLKMFIDYISPMNAFTGKPIGMITDSAGVIGGLKGAETMAGIMRHRKADVIGDAQVFIPEVEKKLVNGKIEDATLLKRIEAAFQAVVAKASTKYQMQMQINEFMDLAIAANRTVRIELNSQVEVVGHLKSVDRNQRGFPTAVSFVDAPVEISNAGQTINYQLIARQTHGLFVPIGVVKTAKGLKSLSDYGSIEKLAELGIKLREEVTITYTSGIEVKGLLSNAFFSAEGKLQVLTLNNATVSKDGVVLKEHNTDLMDLIIGESISSAAQYRSK